MTGAQRLTLALRVTMEIGVVAAFATWGAHTGNSTTARIALAIAAPAVGFGFWGAVDFHQAGRLAEPLRLVQELTVSGLAAAVWYSAGQRALGIALATVSVSYHALVYVTGQRLLKQRPQPRLLPYAK